jgi:hypothetical protein
MEFVGELIHWRGPSPYHFIRLPEELAAEIGAISTVVSYGWGVIPVTARIEGSRWETSLFPKDGGYLLPVKDAVRKAESLTLGDSALVQMAIRA